MSVALFKQEAETIGLVDPAEIKDYIFNRQKQEQENQRVEREERQQAREVEKLREERLKEGREEAQRHELAVIALKNQEAQKAREHELALATARGNSRVEVTGTPQVVTRVPKIKLQPFNVSERIEPFIRRFEETADTLELDEATKRLQFLNLFEGRPLEILHRLDSSARDYIHMREALLTAYGMSAEKLKSQYFNAMLGENETGTQFAARLGSYLDEWREKDGAANTAAGIRDLVLRSQFARSCPDELVANLKMDKVTDLTQMKDMTDSYFEAHGYHKRKRRDKPEKKVHSDQSASMEAQGQSNFQQPQRPYDSRNQYGQRLFENRGQRAWGNQYSGQKSSQQSGGKPWGFKNSQGHQGYPRNEKQWQRNAAAVINHGGDSPDFTQPPPSNSTESDRVQISGALVSSNATNLIVESGYVEGKSVRVMRDNGSTGCIIRKCLVSKSQYTGRQVQLVMIDGTRLCIPEARVLVQTPFFSGVITTAVLGNPIYDLIIGNIPGVKDNSVQSEMNKVTRAAGKRKARTDPLVVASPSEIINNPEVIQEQGTDPTLEGIRKYLRAGNVKVSCDGRSRFVQIQGRIFRESVSSHGEKLLQFVVPVKYRHTVFLLGHHLEGGGHLGRIKTLDHILTNFYWPRIGHTSRKQASSCDGCSVAV